MEQLFKNYTPQQLRDAIEIELQKYDDVKFAAKLAIKRLSKDSEYYNKMQKAKTDKNQNIIYGDIRVMPFIHEHSARILDPEKFDKNSFRSKDIAKGIRIIVGRLKGQKTTTAQTYRFDSDVFTKKEAKDWLKKHDIKNIGFEVAKEEMEKAKDFNKLTRRVITDKNGHRKTVYIKSNIGNKDKDRDKNKDKKIDQTETPEFKKWFGNSKVVDENGKPLVVYHGTDRELNIIQPDYDEPGAWFTSRRLTASSYAKGPDSKIYDVYLKAENPLVVNFEYDKDNDYELTPQINGISKEKIEELGLDNNISIVKYAIKKGFDSVHFPKGNFSEDDNTWVVFHSNQIKSATNNSGKFDEEESDMTKATQLEIGKKIESEHKETIKFIKDYFKKHNKFPSDKEIYMNISKNHVEGSKDEPGLKDYYTRLIEMEDQAKKDKKRPAIEIEVIKFLIKNPNPEDPVIHKYAESKGYDTHEFEKIVYRIATERAMMSKDLKKAMIKIDDNLYIDMNKARVTKYLRKIILAPGKARYIYKEDFKSPFKALLDIFNFSKDKIKKDYDKHNIKNEYNVDEKTFASHLLEYFSNRNKWNDIFKNESSAKKNETGKELLKIKHGIKKEERKPIYKEGKIIFNKNLMRKIYNLYNKKQSEVKDEQRESANISTNNSGKNYSESRIRTAREDITAKPTKEFISENIGRNLNQYQKDFINLSCENFFDKNYPAMFNMDGTGAGKARQTIGLAQTYLEKKPDKPILIVTENKRIIESSFMNDANIMGVDLFNAQNGKEIKSNSIYITTYNRLKDFQENKFGIVLFDESHNLKNKSAQTENGEKIIENSDNVALFSATPIDKGNQIGYIAKAFKLKKTPLMKALGYDLETQWTGRDNIKVWKAQVSAEEIANRIDAMFTNLTKEGMAVKREIPLDNLESKITNIKLTPEQQSKYNQVEQDFFRSISRNPKEKASGLMKLRRFTEELKIDATVDKILNDLKTNDKKQIVLFATRVNDSEVYGEDSIGTLKEISKRLTDKGIEHVNVFASNKQAKNDIDKFQNGEVKVILTTPESGGTGLNLDDVNGDRPRKAIVMTPPFSAMDFIQMAGRINRLNTKSKAEIEMFSTETMVDGWNKDIIANKLLTLGSAVSGDYKKIDIKELDRLQFMSNEDQRQYMKNKGIDNQKISYQEDRKIVLNDFKYDNNNSKTGNDESQKIPKYPLRNISQYETFIPKNFDDEWPDAKINFGKYSGYTLSELQKKDPGYLRWAFGTFSSRASAKVGGIRFYQHENMQKAKYIKRIPNPKGKGYIYFYNEQQLKDYKEKGILPDKNEKEPMKKDKVKPKDREVIKNALKKMANIFAEMFSGKDPVQPTGQAIEQTGEDIKDKAKQKKIEKDKDKK